ncbi:proline--tRNA ligase, cytoplasmic-like [Chenopodium quinoa]|uniref:proline--tRNA ligase, cytoplasmic-like n=1 Tax=Chenopodium quinoa TaxID=63459 RepID=UPI000B783FF1|nr:proline--tRNA ligase, cytoplasmic-like [Chenopodium quinoa]
MTNLVDQVRELLDTIQQNLFDVAKEKRDACVKQVRTWEEFVEALAQKKLILAPWCDEEEVEKEVKVRTKGEIGAAKTLCSPFDQPALELVISLDNFMADSKLLHCSDSSDLRTDNFFFYIGAHLIIVFFCCLNIVEVIYTISQVPFASLLESQLRSGRIGAEVTKL